MVDVVRCDMYLKDLDDPCRLFTIISVALVFWH